MLALDDDIAAFKRMQGDLEAHHKGKWVLFYGAELIDVFDSFGVVASEAVARFGRGPYLIRQVGAPDFVMPSSVMYRVAPQHA